MCGQKLMLPSLQEVEQTETTCSVNSAPEETVEQAPRQLHWDEEGQMYFPDVVQVENAPVVSKNKRKIRFLQIGIASILSVTALLVSLLLFLSGPLEEIVSAVRDTLEEGKMIIQYRSYQDGELAEGSIQLEIHPEERRLTLLAEIGGLQPRRIAIYDDHLILEAGSVTLAQNISRELKEFFDTYEALGKNTIDQARLLELLELLMANPEEYLDLQKLAKCIGNYGKSLNNGKWLGKYAGFEEKKIDGVTCYCFRPDVYEFTRESVTYLEDAFRNAKDYADLMTDLKKAEHDLRNKKFSLVLGAKDGVLSFAEIQTAAATAVRLDIAALGYTKINPTQLEEMLGRAITLG
jgi:hypothetical protein